MEERVTSIFQRGDGIISALSRLSGKDNRQLQQVLERQRREVGRHIGGLQELAPSRLAVWLTEVGREQANEVGGKAAYLGEVKNQLGLPVPRGFILTTEAYRRFCGIPHWKRIRNAARSIEPGDLETLRTASRQLQKMVLASRMPRAIEVALVDRAPKLRIADAGLAVRSSAVGEGGDQTFAGQFLSLINVAPGEIVDAYRKVIAVRFSERALSYRISTGLFEVDSPLAVLVLPVIRAAASGILYTRNPSRPRSKEIWITATRGLGLDIASGRTQADLFVVSRKGRHEVLSSHLVPKHEEIVVNPSGGLERRPLDAEEAQAPSLNLDQLAKLASYALEIEGPFKTPQDIEWAMDEAGEIWILQSRPLVLVEHAHVQSRGRVPREPLLSGGVTVYPGRVSGPAFVVKDMHSLRDTPEGSVVLLRQATPEIVQIFPRIAGLVAEWGNIAGHAAALLREFKIPSLFMVEGLLESARNGDSVSLDSAQRKFYEGELWGGREVDLNVVDAERKTARDPISQNILALNLVDPSGNSFRPGACKSAHDVLRYCHERSVEAMFLANDYEIDRAGYSTKQIKTDVPFNLYVLDLGGGMTVENPEERKVEPDRIVSMPFRSFWRGVTHPGVSWRRELPASLGDLASVVAGTFTAGPQDTRALGMKSYLLVAGEYMNLNSRLAYHYSLVDACLCDDPDRNHVSFRFAGGGATRSRRNLRACFLEACLGKHGFLVHRRGDLVNAWLRNVPADAIDRALDILGRLVACTSQLDMYMENPDTMNWFVEQFMAGNYAFASEKPET